MIFQTLFFIFYYWLVTALGGVIFRNISIKLKSSNKSKLFGIEVSTFYPLVALFFIGNLLLVLNFFTSLKFAKFIVTIIFLFFSKDIFKELINNLFLNFNKNSIHLIVFPLIASVFLVDLGFNYMQVYII